jgi:hypothetical protein
MRLATCALAALPGALTIYLAFNAGGYFPGAPAVLAVVLALVLVLQLTLAERPFDGFGGALFLAGGALGLYAVWTLLSADWSDAPARALIEFDRALLYWLALVLFGALARSERRLALAARFLALALLVVCAIALVTRVLPDLWPTTPEIVNRRLSYPLTYWNTLGLMASLGWILMLHLASSEREPAWARVAGAAGLPILTSTLLLTVSRGAVGALVVGAPLYLLLARPRATVSALLSAVPAAVIAGLATHNAELLTGSEPTGPAAVEQGTDLALVIVLCAGGAALVRLLTLGLDGRLARIAITPRSARIGKLAAAGGALVAVLLALIAFDATGFVERQYDRFVEGGAVDQTPSRLANPGNNRRLEYWQVAVTAFERHPLRGTGAGTYGTEAARSGDTWPEIQNAFSLYLETLSELGIVGLCLLAIALVAVLWGFARGLRGPGRHLHAALLAAGVAWALHAGVDWDWEMPAATLWLFALGGMGLARPTSDAPDRVPSGFARVAIAVGCLALVATPALVAVSEGRMNESVRAVSAGDCGKAIDEALMSLDAVPVRPEPFLVLGVCDIRLGKPQLAERVMRRAVQLDPAGWEGWYGISLARASRGRDPMPALQRALRLNPRGALANKLETEFKWAAPSTWKRRAARARLFLFLTN